MGLFTKGEITQDLKSINELKNEISHSKSIGDRSKKVLLGYLSDVLTGTIAGFAAQGASPSEAACIAVYLNGLAGKLAAENKTQYGVLASDLLEYLPSAIKHIFSAE